MAAVHKYYTGPDKKPGVMGATPTLNRYWTKGPGLARWATNPHPWTTLVRLLTHYLGGNVEVAKGLATEYYHEVFHDYPGSDTAKIRHGRPIRGKKIGRG